MHATNTSTPARKRARGVAGARWVVHHIPAHPRARCQNGMKNKTTGTRAPPVAVAVADTAAIRVRTAHTSASL
jgi:hypothetical protein